MNYQPTILFPENKGYEWSCDAHHLLKMLPTINDASKNLLPSLAVYVHFPDPMMTWLETNSAALITDLYIFTTVEEWQDEPSPRQWCRLFDKLAREATNLLTLHICWDSDNVYSRVDFNRGHGKSVEFVRAVAKLKVKESLVIDGLYGKLWPAYLEQQMGLKPVEKGTLREYQLDYQAGTERLDPFLITQDNPPARKPVPKEIALFRRKRRLECDILDA